MKKLILTIILCLSTAIAFAEEKDRKAEDRIENLPGIWWEQVPTVCVPNTTLLEFTQRKGFQPLNRSFGRNKGHQDGEIVYIVTYWVNVKNNQVMSSVMVPNAEYSCVMYRTFDLEINPYFNWEERIDT